LTWRSILKSGKDILSALSNLVDDKHFRDTLGKAGSFVSIVTAAYDVSLQIKEELSSEEEKAHNSLSKFVLKVTKDFLKSLDKERESATAKNQKEKVGGEETVDNSKIKVELDKSLKQSANIYSLENWDSNMFSHPVVENFVTKLEQDLRKNNYDDNEVKDILFEYKDKLITRAAKDEDYKKFFDWWKGQRHYVEFKRYLTSIEGLKYYRTITE
jgi:hypothetical protein